MINRHFGGIIKECCAEEGGLSAERFGGAALDDLLILFFGQSKLPGDPADCVAWHEPAMNNAEQSYACMASPSKVFSWVVLLKVLYELCDAG